ncbi:OmpP1/FadL family transporter [Sedimenticola hydrogenitrophicus]|uniref:OmpP1/FadL family transporter n=1 Tax=Sedimenticola hydrogenitrophicus TaxID=2967975 RepID=UPI0021A575A8|nr:outer membrane protein transport protein [Sedimenticola hydrogenitrophicus]
MHFKKQLLVTAISSLFVSGAWATNGYFAHGYGMKAKGMGGASTAMAADTFGGANNPASMVWVGDRIDLGADLFSPRREASRQNSTGFGGAYDGESDSDRNYFLIPEFGYNRMINPNLSLGVSVYGNGGMNTTYKSSTLTGPAFAPSCGGATSNLLFGCGKLGVDLMQLVIAPTVAYKVNDHHSIGISPLIGYQRFKVDGLQAFDELGFTSSPGNVTNKGYDDATGFGVRLGWMGRLTDTVSIGAAYSSKINMTEFDKYKGLFAEQGDFDIPENYNIGIAVQATPKLTVAFDVQRINYSDVKSIANPVTASLLSPGPAGDGLGNDTGSGFGWEDQTIYKLGLEYEYNKDLTLRAGWNHGKSPIDGNIDDTSFNILAPATVEDHLTLGFTYRTSTGGEWTMSYMHAFENSITGASAASLLGVGGTETLKMYQDSIGVAYSWKM